MPADVECLPVQHRVRLNPFLQGRVGSKALGPYLASVQQLIQETQIGIAQRDESGESLPRLRDHLVYPDGWTTGLIDDARLYGGHEHSLNVRRIAVESVEVYGAPVDTVETSLHDKGDAQSLPVKVSFREQLVGVKKISCLDAREQRGEFSTGKFRLGKYAYIPGSVLAESRRIPHLRFPERLAQNVIDVDFKVRRNAHDRSVTQAPFPTGVLGRRFADRETFSSEHCFEGLPKPGPECFEFVAR